MKNLIFIKILIIIAFAQISFSQNFEIEDGLNKTIFYGLKPELKTNLIITESDEQAWAMLTVTVAYSSELLVNRYNEIKKRFPEHKLIYIPNNYIAGDAYYEIAGVKNGYIKVLPSVNGPYVNGSIILTKEQTQNILKYAEYFNFNIKFNSGISFMHNKKVPTKYSAYDVCHAVLDKPQKIFELVNLGSKINAVINNLSPIAEVKLLLKDQILNHCFVMSHELANMKNFKDLFNTVISPAEIKSLFHGYAIEVVKYENANDISLSTNSFSEIK